MAKELILAKYGEMALKGLNRGTFEDILMKNLRRRLKKFGAFKLNRAQSTIYMEPLSEDIDLDEVLELCTVDERLVPCVDFGHLYARSQGTELNDEAAPADYAAILDAIAAALPGERAKKFHAHFSRIAYTKGGEKCHLTFADTEFGPPPAPLMQLLKTRGLAPTIICESAGTQAEDAAALKKLYEQG